MARFVCVTLPNWPMTCHWRRLQTLPGGEGSRPGVEVQEGPLAPMPDPSAGPVVPPKPSPHEVVRQHPFALTEKGPKGIHLVAINKKARILGLTPGMRLTDARARVPGLMIDTADRTADSTALRRLAVWMVRFTPLVTPWSDDSILLDITGCAHLFDGEAGVLSTLSARLKKAMIPHRLGLASTPGAAHAISAYGDEKTILPPGGEREGLASLPVDALRLEPAAIRLLKRFGLTQIGQLYPLTRRALARRFQSRDAAGAVVMRLDQALGHSHEPIAPLTPQPDYHTQKSCPAPLLDSDGVWAGLEELAATLCAQLAENGVAARHFTLIAFRTDGTTVSQSVATATPCRTAEHILRLFRERIDRIDPGFGIDLIQLSAHGIDGQAEKTARFVSFKGDAQAGPPKATTQQAAEGHAPDALPADGYDADAVDDVARLVDRLNARLGAGAVCLTHPVESHLPEGAEAARPFSGHFDVSPLPYTPQKLIPLRLLACPELLKVMATVPDGPPLRITWRRVPRRIVRAEGPERIAPEWWGTGPKGRRARDYYAIEDENGRRYWVFREGLYDDQSAMTPQWFMHGFFS